MTKSLNFNPRKLLSTTNQPTGSVRPATMAKLSSSRSPSGRNLQPASTNAAKSTALNSTTPPGSQMTMQQIGKQQQPNRAINSSLSGNSNKMSQKIIQLLKSNDALRNTPGAESTINGLKMGEMKRIPYRKGCSQTVNPGPTSSIANTTKKNFPKMTTAVPKFAVNLGLVRSADRQQKKASAMTPISLLLTSPTPTRQHKPKGRSIQHHHQPCVTANAQKEAEIANQNSRT